MRVDALWRDDTPGAHTRLDSEDAGIEIDVAAHRVLATPLIASVSPDHLSVSDVLSEDRF